MAAELFILRHGQTVFNAERRLQGQCNSPLTPLGERQAYAMGRAIAQQLGHNVQDWQIVSSPLGRTRQTSALVCHGMGLAAAQVKYDARVQEVGLGDWEHGQIEQLLQQYPQFKTRNDWYLDAPNGERLPQVQARLAQWLAELGEQKTIVVSHGLTGMILRAMLLQLSYEQIWLQERPQDALFHYRNGDLSKIAVDPADLQPTISVAGVLANG
ncbi:histidine phosphatase family protein [Shewanella avicenniae]|uniref:Histidine phosphatase family protein n=1 Tax=Shewanella avicenniae TaxID=2814294 RepID=A0ABX7QRN2_9GAMM|nr:histidine phosphatase family protein [Shewanella avicenniae]QSX33351.1 histidine phosphatase family protein [Shewanella avicenniae]